MYDSGAYKAKRDWQGADLKREPTSVAHMDFVSGRS